MRACLRVPGLILLLGASLATAGEPARGPAVMELYTSEGCSSCPPAEAVLSTLAGRSDVITLGFHVTYWDGLGWRDRFGLPEAAGRQQQYVDKLGLASAYTPEVIINGRVDVVGFDRHAIETKLEELPRLAAIAVTYGARHAVLGLPAMDKGECPCDLLLLGVTPDAETAVLAGENKGRTLRASSIVRSIGQVGTWRGGAERRTVAFLPQQDAGLLVALAQSSRDGAVVAAGRVAFAGAIPFGK